MMICHCSLAGTQACKNCLRYKEYFGEQTSFSRREFYEVVSRPKGKWVISEDKEEVYGEYYTCPICKEWTINGRGKQYLNYCPHCGADMREE